ncbi:hypothetical protein B2I21_07380 [Chryseobacterium mucoviscidosis]|nr:hypothetical protein B2I21_07380 [Chryseobacterium mucoviscidosis]
MQDAIRKIQKALRLAENNTNAEEAQAAILMAQRLMLKRGIVASDIKSEQEQTKEAKELLIRKNRIHWWEKRLHAIISDNFRCYSFYSAGSFLGFLGLPEDVEIATEVYKFAEDAIKYHAGNYMKQKDISSRKFYNATKNDYVRGFLAGLNDKFIEQVAQESFALVLVKHEVVETAYNEAELKEDKPAPVTSASNKEAMLQGYEDGKNFNNPIGKLLV